VELKGLEGLHRLFALDLTLSNDAKSIPLS